MPDTVGRRSGFLNILTSIIMKQIRYIDIMRYYVNYNDYEVQLLSALKNNTTDTLLLFTQYKNSYMSVGRNFRSGSDEKILRTLIDFNDFSGEYVVRFSNELKNKEILSGNISNVFSAASKFLWLQKNDTIIIDSNNMASLKVYKNDYKEYCNKWMERYKVQKSEIEDIVEKYSLEEVDSIFSKDWFQMRVFDQFLWGLK